MSHGSNDVAYRPSSDTPVAPSSPARAPAGPRGIATAASEHLWRSFLPLSVVALLLSVPLTGPFALPVLALALWRFVQRIA